MSEFYIQYLKVFWKVNRYRAYELVFFSFLVLLPSFIWKETNGFLALLTFIGYGIIYCSSIPKSPLGGDSDFILTLPLEYRRLLPISIINYIYSTMPVTILFLINGDYLFFPLLDEKDQISFVERFYILFHFIIGIPISYWRSLDLPIETDMREKPSLVRRVCIVIRRLFLYFPGSLFVLISIALFSPLIPKISLFSLKIEYFLFLIIAFLWWKIFRSFENIVDEHHKCRNLVKKFTFKDELKSSTGLLGFGILFSVLSFFGFVNARVLETGYKPSFKEVSFIIYDTFVGRETLRHAIQDDKVERSLKLISKSESTGFDKKVVFEDSSPLFYAAMNGGLKVFSAIYDLEYPKTINVKNSKICKKDSKCVEEDLVNTVAKKGDLKKIRFLVEKGHSLESSDKTLGRSPAHFAAIDCHEKLFDYLADKVNLNRQDYWGNTPLHYSAKGNCKYVTHLLLVSGADKKIKNKEGKLAIDLTKNESLIFKMLNK